MGAAHQSVARTANLAAASHRAMRGGAHRQGAPGLSPTGRGSDHAAIVHAREDCLRSGLGCVASTEPPSPMSVHDLHSGRRTPASCPPLHACFLPTLAWAGRAGACATVPLGPADCQRDSGAPPHVICFVRRLVSNDTLSCTLQPSVMTRRGHAPTTSAGCERACPERRCARTTRGTLVLLVPSPKRNAAVGRRGQRAPRWS